MGKHEGQKRVNPNGSPPVVGGASSLRGLLSEFQSAHLFSAENSEEDLGDHKMGTRTHTCQ